MKVNSAIHETHSAGLIQNLEVFFIDLIIANNEINKKPKSNHLFEPFISFPKISTDKTKAKFKTNNNQPADKTRFKFT